MACCPHCWLPLGGKGLGRPWNWTDFESKSWYSWLPGGFSRAVLEHVHSAESRAVFRRTCAPPGRESCFVLPSSSVRWLGLRINRATTMNGFSKPGKHRFVKRFSGGSSSRTELCGQLTGWLHGWIASPRSGRFCWAGVFSRPLPVSVKLTTLEPYEFIGFGVVDVTKS